MPADLNVFRQRLLAAGWGQGSLIPWRGELVSAIAGEGLRAVDLRRDGGGPAAGPDEADGAFVLVSQLCDLLASFAAEPFAVAIPAGVWDPDPAEQLPLRNSSRHLVIDGNRRLVASQARLITFPKELLPERPNPPAPDLRPEAFAAWCARRWRRIPLPDVFAETVQRALGDAIKRVGMVPGRQATACWRVEFLGASEDGRPVAEVYALRDETALDDEEGFSKYVAEVDAQLRIHLERHERKVRERTGGEVRSYELRPLIPTDLARFSVRDAIDCPMIGFDHLSPEPEEDEDGAIAELRDEDML